MKSVMNIVGSPHKDSFTAILNNCVLDHIDKYGLNVVSAYERNVRPCIDCKYCGRVERCRYDDMDDIDAMLRECEMMVIATPIYNMSVPSPLKAILDRMQRYYMARFSLGLRPPIKKHKDAILLTTCGCSGGEEARVVEEQLRRIFTVINTSLVGTILWSGTDSKDFDLQLQISNTHDKIEKILDKIKS